MARTDSRRLLRGLAPLLALAACQPAPPPTVASPVQQAMFEHFALARDLRAAHRARLRKQGLRPIQIWVPDVRSPTFRAEAHRQFLVVAASAHEAEDQAFIDAISDPGDA